MARASSRRVQRRLEERKDLLDAQEVPSWHGEAVPMRLRRHRVRGRCRWHVGKASHPLALDLVEGKAKQLKTQLEVAMAEIHGAGGNRAEGVEGVIEQISWTGRSAAARSIDWHPSRWLTPAEVIEIKRGGGRATQLPEHRREEGEKRARGNG
jgi:hypothetical protein